MMKKTFKQLLGLTLSTAMVISMAGCGNEAVTNTETQVVSKETETTQAKESETQVTEKEEITYPLDSDETITMWTRRLSLNSDYSDYTESPFHTGLAKNMGVDIEFQFVQPGQNANEAYNLLLTEDVLPDVINNSMNNTKLTELYNDGVIYDLTPYLEEYAPDYWEYLTAPGNEANYRGAATADGKILAFWSLREPGSDFSITYMGPVIRQDWLDECGLKAPVTLEDWETVLTAFKEKYNATLGFNATYLKYPLFASGAGAYGTGGQANSTMLYVDDAGKVQLSCMQPEWVEYMKVMRDWYKKGLIDNDSVTMDDAAVRTKAANNQIGASFTAMSQLSNFITDVKANSSDAKWVGVGYPRTAAGEATSMIQYGAAVVNNATFITTDCPEDKLITVIKALNYCYTEEGIMYLNFGTENETYTLDSAGNPQWTDLVLNDPQGTSACISKYTGVHSSGIGVQLDAFLKLKNVEEATSAVLAWIDNTDAAKHYLPGVELTDDENLAITDKFVAIQTYLNEMTQKFLLGTESLDKIDDFYAQLEKMGTKECLEVYQAAYDRYIAK